MNIVYFSCVVDPESGTWKCQPKEEQKQETRFLLERIPMIIATPVETPAPPPEHPVDEEGGEGPSADQQRNSKDSH